MSKSPLLSVVLPVYNQSRFLQQAVDSVLGQTFDDFELIVLDDGSSDETQTILKEYDDARVKVHRFLQNRGLVANLNYGISIARGRYIARMDGDDVALPERFATQLAFLEENSVVGACGTFIDKIDATGRVLGKGWVRCVYPAHIKFMLLFGCPICHPSVMLRKSVLNKYGLRYDPRYTHGQDYDLWYRLSKVSLLVNIPQVLLRYRIHAQQVSCVNVGGQEHTSLAVLRAQLDDLGIIPTPAELETHMQLSHYHFKVKKSLAPERFIAWITKIKIANAQRHVYDQEMVAAETASIIEYYSKQSIKAS